MKLPVEHPELDPLSQPEIKELAELVGQFIEYWGFKAVQGRVWCYLYLSQEPLSSVDLAQLVEISPALVTQSVQILLKYRVILASDKGRNGILRFQANPNAAEAIAGVLASREAKLLDAIHGAGKRVRGARLAKKKGIHVDQARVDQLFQWVTLARWLMKGALNLLDTADNPFVSPKSYRDPKGFFKVLEHLPRR